MKVFVVSIKTDEEVKLFEYLDDNPDVVDYEIIDIYDEDKE